ncbi:MAG: MFS transporter, partial [Chloroflexi bacterium]|nr:MFS transporter [Chloroflexota bacterium]
MDKQGTSPPRPAGQNKILYIFSYAHFSEHLYSVLLVPLLPFIRDQFGLSYLEAGLLISAFSIAAGIANLPMGWLADRLGMKYILALGIGGGGLAAMAIGFTTGYYQLFFLTILTGLLSGAYHPVSAAFLGGFFEPRRRGRALGIHMVGGSFGVMAAPVIGGLLAEWLDWRWAFIILAIPAL